MPERIAFVDDEELVLGTLSRIFEREPYEVFTFDTPSKAIKEMEKHPFCVGGVGPDDAGNGWDGLSWRSAREMAGYRPYSHDRLC